MIKFNETYSINNGQGTIVFKDLGNSSVEATYEIKGNKVPGIINGKVENGNLKSIFQVGAAKGLMDFTFTEGAFISMWKKGIEEGPMKGKWEGSLLNKTNATPPPKKVEEKKLAVEPSQAEKELSEKALELKKLEESLLQKQKELEAKEAELAKKVAPPIVVPPKIVETPKPAARVFKIVTVKITNTTKMKVGYSDDTYSMFKLINKKLPKIGISDHYTLKYEILKDNYKLTKGVLLDLFSQEYIQHENKYELIRSYKDDSQIETDDFHEIICETKINNISCCLTCYGKDSIHTYYSFKISIISIE
jgi:hypothetical protein